MHTLHCQPARPLHSKHTRTLLDNTFSHFLFSDKILTCPVADTRTFSSSSSAFQRGSVWTRLYTLTRLRLNKEPALKQIRVAGLKDKQKRRRRRLMDAWMRGWGGLWPQPVPEKVRHDVRGWRDSGFGPLVMLRELCWRGRERREKEARARTETCARAHCWANLTAAAHNFQQLLHCCGQTSVGHEWWRSNASLELAQKSFVFVWYANHLPSYSRSACQVLPSP